MQSDYYISCAAMAGDPYSGELMMKQRYRVRSCLYGTQIRCILLFILLFIVQAAGAQPTGGKSVYPDVARQRLLIRITAQYLHTINQGQIEMDSAIRIPCRLYGFSILLPYNEGYSDGKPTTGSALINAGRIREAKALLARTKGTDKIRALAELSAYFIFRPGTEKADLDEAMRLTDEAVTLSRGNTKWLIETLTLRAQLLQQYGRDDASRKVFAAVLDLCKRTKDDLALARTQLSAGACLRYGDPARLEHFENALHLFRAQNDREKVIEALSQVNIEYFATKRPDIAANYLKELISICEKIGFYHVQYPYDGLAYMAYRQAHLSESLKYSNHSLEGPRTAADSVFIGYFYTRRGILCQYLLKFQEAIKWFDRALAEKAIEDKTFAFRATIGKAGALISLNRPEEALEVLLKFGQHEQVTDFVKMHYAFYLGTIYEQLRQPRLAELNYKKFLTLADVFPVEYVHDEIPYAYFQVSTFYRHIGRTDVARKLLDQGMRLNANGNIIGTGIYYLNLFKIDSTEKRYLNAIQDLQKTRLFMDSLYSYDEIKKTRELLVKYEAEKKDKDIKLLNSEKQVAQVQAKEADRTKNITLAGLALSAVIVLLLIWLYVSKRKVNRKLEDNQRELDQKNSYLESLNQDKDKLLKEKEWLIREVHHRVKNNLQMVTSLLVSQSVYLEDKASVMAIKDSLRRMQAMSLIHQKLYQDDKTTTIYMPEYFTDLVKYIHESFDAGVPIHFEVDIDDLELDVSQAVPLGLIVTESIVNAIKYAFLNGQEGIVRISLKKDGPDHLLLQVSDNGKGLPAEFRTTERSSLGLDLMQGLSRQLNGDFSIENKDGVHITVRFTTINKYI